MGGLRVMVGCRGVDSGQHAIITAVAAVKGSDTLSAVLASSKLSLLTSLQGQAPSSVTSFTRVDERVCMWGRRLSPSLSDVCVCGGGGGLVS